MKNLLIIDDSRTILGALQAAVEASGRFRPFFAQNYAEANELVQQYRFFAAIVDLELPDCKAGAAVNLTLSHHVPTIVLTGTMNEKLRDEILNRPIVDYLVKSSLEDINMAVYAAENLLMFEGQRALVIDDSRTSRAGIRMLFELLLFEVVEAEGPDEALAILEKDKDFRILTIDYTMPKMHGIDLLQEIRRMTFEYPPICFGVVGSDKDSLRYRFLKSGANDVFVKPLIREEFNNKVANILRLAESQSELEEYFKTVDRYVLVSATDQNGVITYASRAFCALSGYTKEELIGKGHSLIRHPEMPSTAYADLWKTIMSGKVWIGELKNRAKDGRTFWTKMVIDPVRNRQGVLVGFRAVRQDITDRKRVEELAITDQLTQIYNRIHLDSVMLQKIAEATRHGSGFSVVILDVDKFKSVNDTHGHQVGDSVLKETAQVLSSHVRECDILGRWGGEEFLVIAPETDLEGGRQLAEKLRAAMEGFTFSVIGQKTASFGVSSFRQGDTEESLIKRADDALYAAKNNGRNRVEVETD